MNSDGLPRKHARSPRSLLNDSKASEMLPVIARILRERGPEGFALGAIAEELGTSSRMLIYHFGSRDELLGRVMRVIRQDTIESLEQPPPVSLDEAIQRFWSYYVHDGHITDMQLFFHIASRRFAEPERFDDFASTAVDGWVHYFARAVEAEGKGEEFGRKIGRLAIAVLRGIVVDYLVTADETNTEQSLELFRLLVRSAVQAQLTD